MNLKRKGTLWEKRSRKLKFFITNPAQLDRSNWTVDTYCVLHRTNVITYQVSNRFMCFVFCFYWLINLKICLITPSSDNYANLFFDDVVQITGVEIKHNVNYVFKMYNKRDFMQTQQFLFPFYLLTYYNTMHSNSFRYTSALFYNNQVCLDYRYVPSHHQQ